MANVQTEAGLRNDSEIALHLVPFLKMKPIEQEGDFALMMWFQRRNPCGWSSHVCC